MNNLFNFSVLINDYTAKLQHSENTCKFFRLINVNNVILNMTLLKL
jgi:hypothetical protein